MSKQFGHLGFDYYRKPDEKFKRPKSSLSETPPVLLADILQPRFVLNIQWTRARVTRV